MYLKSIATNLVLFLVAGGGICWGADFDFRHARWGMTRAEVLATEDLKPVEQNTDKLRYTIEILERNVDLYFTFADDKLVGAFYKLKDNYLNSNHFIRAYNQFKAALEKKYGPPKDEKTVWSNNFYKNASVKRGLALSLGHVKYYSLWETGNSTIKCRLQQTNYDILCLVEYDSKEYANLSKMETVKEGLDPF